MKMSNRGSGWGKEKNLIFYYCLKKRNNWKSQEHIISATSRLPSAIETRLTIEPKKKDDEREKRKKKKTMRKPGVDEIFWLIIVGHCCCWFLIIIPDVLNDWENKNQSMIDPTT